MWFTAVIARVGVNVRFQARAKFASTAEMAAHSGHSKPIHDACDG